MRLSRTEKMLLGSAVFGVIGSATGVVGGAYLQSRLQSKYKRYAEDAGSLAFISAAWTFLSLTPLVSAYLRRRDAEL